MATITWKGVGDDGPEETEGFKGMKFKKGEAVECDNPEILARAARNQYFEVSGWEPEAKEDQPTYDVTKDVTVKPPSQQSAQHPVVKHGDVKTLEATLPNPPDPVVPPEPPPEGESQTNKTGFKPIPLK